MPATTMQVQLLTMTPDAESLIYAACKSCTSQDDAADVYKRLTVDPVVSADHVNELIRRVIDSGHTSVVECAQFSFAISGISRACSHQLVRHRVGTSCQQQSQRYVKADDFEYVVPLSIKKHESSWSAQEVFNEAMYHIKIAYELLPTRGIPAEDARFVLPNACATKVVVTMNCRALLHFFSLRCCVRAQWEIRAMANAMLAICEERLPVVFSGRGARCEALGYCTEDKSCGRYPKLADVVARKEGSK